MRGQRVGPIDETGVQGSEGGDTKLGSRGRRGGYEAGVQLAGVRDPPPDPWTPGKKTLLFLSCEQQEGKVRLGLI